MAMATGMTASIDSGYAAQASLTALNRKSDNQANLAGGLAIAQAKARSPEALEKTAKDFESLFVGQMLEQMFGESSGSDSFGSSETDDVYKGLMVEQYGKQISNTGGIGIADYVKRELLTLQEK
jgi:flagellar protein FlgJ